MALYWDVRNVSMVLERGIFIAAMVNAIHYHYWVVAEADVSICVVLMIHCQIEANASYFCLRASATFLG